MNGGIMTDNRFARYLELVCLSSMPYGKDDENGYFPASYIYENAVCPDAKAMATKSGVLQRFCKGKGIILRGKPFHLVYDPSCSLLW